MADDKVAKMYEYHMNLMKWLQGSLDRVSIKSKDWALHS